MAAWTDVRRRLRQALCGLYGHDKYLHVDGARVTLRCVGCAHESPGWETGDRHYNRTYAGDPSRHRLTRGKDAKTD